MIFNGDVLGISMVGSHLSSIGEFEREAGLLFSVEIMTEKEELFSRSFYAFFALYVLFLCICVMRL